MQLINSIRLRYAISLTGNFAKAGINLVSSIIIARLLGPEDTGRLFFLLFTFQSFLNIIDLNSTAAFFTFTSKQNLSKYHFKAFLNWTILQLIISLILVGLLLPDKIISSIWLNESNTLILLALVACFMQSRFWQLASQIAEAERKTLRLQIVANIASIIHLFSIIILWYNNFLNLHSVLTIVSLEWLCASILLIKSYSYTSDNNEDKILLFKRYLTYCMPLFPCTLISLFHGFLEKWFLQNWGGATEQGYYGMCLKISSIVILVTTSFINIFWKEIAELKNKGSHNEMFAILNASCKLSFLFSTLVVSVFLPWSSFFVPLILGNDYIDALDTFMVLMLYPIFQSIGQLTSSFLLAVEETFLSSIIGVIFCLSSMSLTYFLLAPSGFFIPGLNLGSFGLSLSTVILNLFYAFGVLIFINSRFNIRYSLYYIFYGILFFLTTFLLKYILCSLFNSFILIISFYLLVVTFILLYIFLKNKSYISLLFNLK